MIYYLLVCMDVSGGSSCLPLQRMPSEASCMFAAAKYREAMAQTGNRSGVAAKCLGLR